MISLTGQEKNDINKFDKTQLMATVFSAVSGLRLSVLFAYKMSERKLNVTICPSFKIIVEVSNSKYPVYVYNVPIRLYCKTKQTSLLLLVRAKRYFF